MKQSPLNVGTIPSCATFMTFITLALLPLPALAAAAPGPGGKPIRLLQPLPDGTQTLAPNFANPLGILGQYLTPMLGWMFGVAAGLAIFMVVIGGLQIVMAGGNDAKISEGRQRITQAIIGLILLTFSAGILNYLNASFFHLGP